MATRHQVSESPSSENTRGEIDTSYWLTVTWEARGRLLAIVPTERTMVGVLVTRIDVEVWVDREDRMRICIR